MYLVFPRRLEGICYVSASLLLPQRSCRGYSRCVVGAGKGEVLAGQMPIDCLDCLSNLIIGVKRICVLVVTMGVSIIVIAIRVSVIVVIPYNFLPPSLSLVSYKSDPRVDQFVCSPILSLSLLISLFLSFFLVLSRMDVMVMVFHCKVPPPPRVGGRNHAEGIGFYLFPLRCKCHKWHYPTVGAGRDVISTGQVPVDGTKTAIGGVVIFSVCRLVGVMRCVIRCL